MYTFPPPLHTHTHAHIHCLQAGCVYLKTTIDGRRDLFWTSLQMHWRPTVRDGSFGLKSHSWPCGGRSRRRPGENNSESEFCVALFQLFFHLNWWANSPSRRTQFEYFCPSNESVAWQPYKWLPTVSCSMAAIQTLPTVSCSVDVNNADYIL